MPAAAAATRGTLEALCGRRQLARGQRRRHGKVTHQQRTKLLLAMWIDVGPTEERGSLDFDANVVYILLSADRLTTYRGKTPDISRRIKQHNSKSTGTRRFTNQRAGMQPWDVAMLLQGFSRRAACASGEAQCRTEARAWTAARARVMALEECGPYRASDGGCSAQQHAAFVDEVAQRYNRYPGGGLDANLAGIRAAARDLCARGITSPLEERIETDVTTADIVSGAWEPLRVGRDACAPFRLVLSIFIVPPGYVPPPAACAAAASIV
jgi:predicted GIY-YIG superfamily endonuclease